MGAAEGPEKPIRLFYSYSHRDEELRKKLEDHLAALRWSGKIAEWHDRNIDVGDEWANEIDRNLSSADIILLLVSASFIASEYCWSVEVKKALERHDKGEAKVIPVILRPCVWDITPFAKLQAAPTDAKPVTSWSDPDAALYAVAGKIERAVMDLQQQRRRAAEEAQHRAEETRKSEEAEARRAAEEQQREAQRQPEQDEARRAAEAEVARVPKTSRYHEERMRQRLKLIAALGLVVLVGFAGVFAWRQWPTQEQPQPAETARKKAPAPPTTTRALKPLDVFADCLECPEMVVIPGGTFVMGSPADEPGRLANEGPQQRVTIPPFAIGKTEVTFAEWDACVAAGGCNGYKPSDEGWGRGSRPVINVSWKDANAYVSWLSQHTGKAYRLPYDGEWEYACRAGTTTRYAFGDAITPKDANYNYSAGRTTVVGSYPPNAWGLYDMHGNVWEWTYGEGVFRGGAFNEVPKNLRCALRLGIDPDYRGSIQGFRVARTLD